MSYDGWLDTFLVKPFDNSFVQYNMVHLQSKLIYGIFKNTITTRSITTNSLPQAFVSLIWNENHNQLEVVRHLFVCLLCARACRAKSVVVQMETQNMRGPLNVY